MYIFTLWSGPMPKNYADCCLAIKRVYPKFTIENFDVPQEFSNYSLKECKASDILRFKRLLEIDDDVLYLDADCVPGELKLPRLRLTGFYESKGCGFDISVIFKPKGKNDIIKYIYDAANSIDANLKSTSYYCSHAYVINEMMTNKEVLKNVVGISGDPDDTYFKHMAFTSTNKLKR